MKLDSELIWNIARREASLGFRSKSVWTVLCLVVLGSCALVYSTALNLDNHESDPKVTKLIIGMFITVALSIGIMMNTTLVGGSISEEKDNKVVEILLSCVRAEELYVGKILGHSFLGIIQLVFLWHVILFSAIAFGIVSIDHFPWLMCFLLLFFMLLAYIFSPRYMLLLVP